jgi:hypothetical protein
MNSPPAKDQFDLVTLFPKFPNISGRWRKKMQEGHRKALLFHATRRYLTSNGSMMVNMTEQAVLPLQAKR